MVISYKKTVCTKIYNYTILYRDIIMDGSGGIQNNDDQETVNNFCSLWIHSGLRDVRSRKMHII